MIDNDHDSEARYDLHVVILINYVRRHHVLVLNEIAKRVQKLTVLVSTPMEGDRSWDPQWDDLDVRVQKNWTLTLNQASGFKEKNFIHFPIDTISQLRELQPDIVFSYEMGMRSLLSATYRRFRKDLKLVLVGNMSDAIERYRGMLRKTARKLVKSGSDYCTYNGPSCKRYLQRLGYEEDQLLYFPYCFDPEKTYTGPIEFSDDHVRRLLFCGFLTERKAVLPLVQTLMQYCENNPDREVEVDVAGDGPMRDALERCQGDNFRLRLLGNCGPAELRECYRRADLCIFSSLGDEWGLVPMEAWASGVPVMGSVYAQSVETVLEEGRNGWSFDSSSEQDTLAAFSRFMSTERKQLVEMGHYARESVSCYSASRSADYFCEALEHVLPQKSLRRRADVEVAPLPSPPKNKLSVVDLKPIASSRHAKPVASMSLDLDNKWSYLKSHDDPSWESYPSYLSYAVPRIVRILEEFNLKITFFVVGQDAALEANRESLQMIADAGHEIANHSFHHEPRLHLYRPEQLEREFDLSEAAIEAATGKKTVGFRGPGFSLSDQTLNTLIRRGYEYDGTAFPTYMAPLARAFYFMTGSFNREQKKEREALFGSFRDGFSPNTPYLWKNDEGMIVEIPVTTFPGIKVPLHATYLQYLAGFSELTATTYFAAALKAFRWSKTSPSFLLHPLDFIGLDDEPDLAFFPGMKLPADAKLRRMKKFLSMLTEKFELTTMRRYATAAIAQKLPDRPIQMARSGLT